jgi:hypothetical protein
MEKDLKRLNKSEKSTFDEFVYILGLSIYDIFSKNHEVVGQDNKIYDFGTFRGCGRFIADFLNNYLSDNSKKYDYMDFYMGTSWNNEIIPRSTHISQSKNCKSNLNYPKAKNRLKNYKLTLILFIKMNMRRQNLNR